MTKPKVDVWTLATKADIAAAIKALMALPQHPDTASLKLRFLALLIDARNWHHDQPINSLSVALKLLGLSFRLHPDADISAIEAGGLAAYERAIVNPMCMPRLDASMRAIIKGHSRIFYFPTPDEFRREIIRLGERPANDDTGYLNAFVHRWMTDNAKRPAAEQADLDEFCREVAFRYPQATEDDVADACEWALAYHEFQATTRRRDAEIEAEQC